MKSTIISILAIASSATCTPSNSNSATNVALFPRGGGWGSESRFVASPANDPHLGCLTLDNTQGNGRRLKHHYDSTEITLKPMDKKNRLQKFIIKNPKKANNHGWYRLRFDRHPQPHLSCIGTSRPSLGISRRNKDDWGVIFFGKKKTETHHSHGKGGFFPHESVNKKAWETKDHTFLVAFYNAETRKFLHADSSGNLSLVDVNDSMSDEAHTGAPSANEITTSGCLWELEYAGKNLTPKELAVPLLAIHPGISLAVFLFAKNFNENDNHALRGSAMQLARAAIAYMV